MTSPVERRRDGWGSYLRIYGATNVENVLGVIRDDPAYSYCTPPWPHYFVDVKGSRTALRELAELVDESMQLTIAIDDELVIRLVRTALHVSGYWCQVADGGSPYKAEEPIECWPLVSGGYIAFQVDGLDDRVTLDSRAVERGLGLLLTCPKGSGIPAHHAERFLEGQADNETADVFLQLALLGQIEYSR